MSTAALGATRGRRSAKPYWGLGYATEDSAAALKFGFTQLGLSLIEHAMPDNLASLLAMAKLGLRHRDETRS